MDHGRKRPTTTERSLEQHLDAALATGFNAVFFVTTPDKTMVVKYLQYGFKVTEDDCADTADFSAMLYVNNAKKKKKAPMDEKASCICGKYYYRKTNELGCTQCGRWCHDMCVLSGTEITPALLDTIEASWVCPVCHPTA